jgi:adenosine deaminase
MNLFRAPIIACLMLSHNIANANVTQYFDTIKSDPNALYAFLKEMPKGGELHYHLAGGAYAETMLEVAGSTSYCLDTRDYSASTFSERCDGIDIDALPNHPQLYQETIRAWSMKDFTSLNQTGHDHFFNSFPKFLNIVSDFRPQLLAAVMQRAANQNEHYMEIMILPDNAASTRFGKTIKNIQTTTQKRSTLLKNQAFKDNIKHTIKETDRILNEAKKVLACDSNPGKSVCQLKVTFQYYILREQPIDQFFAQAINAFEAVSQSDQLVSINLVQPEDGVISLRDYGRQMALLKALHKIYPKVHIALHAGELTPKLVPYETLIFHIREAIFTGQAERIGHGVDIAYEDNSQQLLKHMAKHQIPVEINLTSNREVLNVYGRQHPLNYYLKHNVPVVLSTDDEGILRTNLTQEYVEAAFIHNLTYQQLKTITRNAITYSFLPGKSLWQKTNSTDIVPECKNLDGQNCQQFIRNSEKATLQMKLEKELVKFEQKF